ncbi:acyl-CoA-binding protein [Flavicella sp.]|uniref:acyl-CoA-binding protein n=1 Tax=Flavicella sp. TaxID=2957742 RepID=UPI002635B056|nr:acyl-CoA-binding protein [Flavicella sp.]MDG1804685.1 acyl-CoA-binding protein [Flavicella sp.]
MSVDKELHKEFEKAYAKASAMKTPLPQDTMLLFYAYYKQATAGDNFSFNANFDVRNAFKFNAWMQLKGISPEEAKRKYIDLVNKYSK